MDDVEDYIYSKEGSQREVLLFLDDLLTVTYGLESKIRYKVPFYYGKSWICYLNPIKDDKIELAFLRGNELANSLKILNFKDRKQVAGIEFESMDSIDIITMKLVMEEAIFLDETVPYQSKRK